MLKSFLAASLMALSLCASQSSAFADDEVGTSITVPCESTLTTDRKAVIEILRLKAKALGMGWFKSDALLALADSAEHRDLFKPIHAPTLFGVRPEQLTPQMIADRVFQIFKARELERLRPRSFRERAKDFIVGTSRKTIVRTGVIMGAIPSFIIGMSVNNALFPWTSEPLGELTTYSSNLRDLVDEAVTAPGRDNDPTRHASDSETERQIREMLSETFNRVNSSRTLPEREARSYYDSVNLTLIDIGNAYRLLQHNRPVQGSQAHERWLSDIRYLRDRLMEQPVIYSEVYLSERGQVVLLPRLHELVCQMHEDLGEAPVSFCDLP